ncbi:MAG: hypothetical protein WDN02_11045 [Methylovirgula sp.]|uniref:hypothetical protein n=1 Tax=Methylovirgula sp. TaxID=1978224 RepID=UPI0030763E55
MVSADERIKALEARIEELEKQGDFRWEQTKKNLLVLDQNWEREAKLGKRANEIMWEEIQRLDKLTRQITKDLATIQRQHLRYDEAYYHAFPDRLDQDVKVAEQFGKVILKPDGDDDSKKL